MKTDAVVILITCSCSKEAHIISASLVKKHLAACANVMGPVKSRFWWNGRIDKAGEVMLMCKTTKKHFAAVEREVKRLHTYEVPEIIALPIIAGSKDYLKWIKDSAKK